MVLNNTQDRDTAILGLIKAVNELCNKPSHSNYNTNPSTPTDVPEREQRPRKRPQRQRRKWKRPSATERAKIKRKRHRLYYKKKLRTTNKLSNNIVNLSNYNLPCAEKSILSKGLSFIPKPKSIDADDINIGMNRLRKQMCSQYMQATKPSQHQASTSTIIISDTQDVTDPDTEIYDPWDTMKLFKQKTETSKAVSNNDCINQVLNKLEEEIMSLADKTKQNIKDNVSKAERLTLRSLKENIVINKTDKW